jgi:hypothetical protein
MLFGGARSASGETSPGLGYLQPPRHRSFQMFASKYRPTMTYYFMQKRPGRRGPRRDLLFHAEAAGPTRTLARRGTSGCLFHREAAGPTRTCYFMQKQQPVRRGPISPTGTCYFMQKQQPVRRGPISPTRDLLFHAAAAGPTRTYSPDGDLLSCSSSSRSDEDLFARRGPVISCSSSRSDEDLLARRGPVISCSSSRADEDLLRAYRTNLHTLRSEDCLIATSPRQEQDSSRRNSLERNLHARSPYFVTCFPEL